MTKKKYSVAIIDYSMGNIFSIEQACQLVELNAHITSKKKVIMNSDAVILPGVGAFETAIKNINDLDLFQTLLDFAGTGKPFIGICLGAQLLLEKSEEFGLHTGLGLIKGKAVHFRSFCNNNALIVPHIGWNKVMTNKKYVNHPLTKFLDGNYFYFIHSYVLKPQNDENILAHSIYNGYEFVSAIGGNNIVGFQFHPENSGEIGLMIFKGIKKIIKETI